MTRRCGAQFFSLFFVASFRYGVLPASALFSLVCGWTLSTYSFKASVFLLTGSISVTGLALPEALVAHPAEWGVGLAMSAASAALFWLYSRQAQRLEQKGFRRLDPPAVQTTSAAAHGDDLELGALQLPLPLIDIGDGERSSDSELLD